MAVTVPYEGLAALRERAKEEVGKVVVGQGQAVELLLVAAMARGHVLLEGPPGTAKTLLGRATAYVLGADFNRVQFTPDTTPRSSIGENVIARGRDEVHAGHGVHERAARGRDQPDAAAHAGRAPRGDGRAQRSPSRVASTGCRTPSS